MGVCMYVDTQVCMHMCTCECEPVCVLERVWLITAVDT